MAHRYLRRSGFTVAARNWRPPQGGGELDLIAWEGAELVFVEVKTRVSAEGNAPERDIDQEKMRALRRAAEDYVRRAGAEDAEIRFDVISIAAGKLVHFRNAFPFSP